VEPSGLRERKKAHVRRQLVEAALEAFLDNGFDETTIDDIVAEAMVSRRTFFRYFDSKDAVVLAWLDDGCSAVVAAFEKRPVREPPLVAMRHAFVEAMAYYEDDRPHFLSIERLIAATPPIRAAKRERLGRLSGELARVMCRRAGQDVRRALAPRVLAGASTAAVDAAIEMWMLRDGRGPLHAVIVEAFETLATRR
jgi:AcrR family transcriptional regulator